MIARVLLASALLVLPRAQDDADQATKAALAKVFGGSFGGMNLVQFVTLIELSMQVKLSVYIDGSEVKDAATLKVSATRNQTVDAILKSMNESGIAHAVFQGAVVISTPNGCKAFEDTAWSGFTLKSVEGKKELSEKLKTLHAFDWSPYDAAKALQVLAKASGVTIHAGAIAKVKNPAEGDKPRQLFPQSTTLYGALVCLSRATGITFSVGEDGSITAKPPLEKK